MDLESFRKSRGWTQADLAKTLGLRSKSHVCNIEKGRHRCSVALALRIQRITNGEVRAVDLRPDDVELGRLARELAAEVRA